MPSLTDRSPSRPAIAAHAAVAASAARRYRDTDLGARIAAATPHELVLMLYDGARTALDGAARATQGGRAAARLSGVTRALAILDALDATLDHGRGGGVARALAASYAQVRALVVAGNVEANAELLAAAASQIGALGAGWAAIAPAARAAA